MYVFSPNCCGFGFLQEPSGSVFCCKAGCTLLPSSLACLAFASGIMDGAASGWSFTGKCEGDTWTQDKRELVNIFVFREILLQIALENIEREKKDRQKERGRKEKAKFKSKQKL